MARTGNGDYAYDSTGSALLEFFSKAGSQLKGKQNFYGEEASAISLFRPAWTTNSYKAMQLAMWVRDCRGGAGNRSGFRDIIKWIAEKDSKWIETKGGRRTDTQKPPISPMPPVPVLHSITQSPYIAFIWSWQTAAPLPDV